MGKEGHWVRWPPAAKEEPEGADNCGFSVDHASLM